MIYLLLGEDDFSKREFLLSLQSEKKLNTESFFDDAEAQQIINAANSGSLFGGQSLIKLYGIAEKLNAEQWKQLKKSSNILVFIETTLDKRKSEVKQLLADKDIAIKEFNVPSGAEFKKWVLQRANKYNIDFEPRALEMFLQRLGIGQGNFGREIYDLWQAEMELLKLKAFAQNHKVSADTVQNLTAENLDENVFNITNAIGDRKKPVAVQLLTNYMDRFAGVDEKNKVISLSALLAEQFRGILMVKNMAGKPDAEIAKVTGYNSGRLFVYKKIAGQFAIEKILEFLRKLELLDEETKTSSNPASLQFFMIIDSVLR